MKLVIRMTRLEDGTYRAWCPALPGCTVFGESIPEARTKIELAVEGYLAHLQDVLPRELGRQFQSEATISAA
jgi:predicted RNase H-like HicB family nuclease